MIFLKLAPFAARIKTEKIRITAFLLSVLILFTTIPPVAFAEGACICPDGAETHWATCPLYSCPDCGASDCYGDCPEPDAGEGDEPGTGEGDAPGTSEGDEPGTGEGDEPGTGEGDEPGTGEGDEPSVDPNLCDICGSDPCTCPDYVFHVDKIAALNPDGYPHIPITEDAPDENWTEYCLDFAPEDFSEDVLFQIDAYKVVSESVAEGIAETLDEGEESESSQTLESLWYQVHIVKGSAIDSFTDGSWIFQNYLDDDPAYDTLLIGEHEKCPVCDEYDCETEHVKCPACGEYDCGIEHVKCDICDGYDCHHIRCGVCGEMDCEIEHIYCPICRNFDCELEHEYEPEVEPYIPPTEPVIPENPQLPAAYDVAIVDDSGALVTQDDDFLLPVGYKATLSAWSKEDADSYQWQICYDAENDLWVDISGQTGKAILFSHALFSGISDDGGALRCVIHCGSGERISAPITVRLIDVPAGSGAALMSLRSRGEPTSMTAADGPALMAETPSRVTITIHYLEAKSSSDSSEMAVTIPYTAQIEAGSTFKETIRSPSRPGYAPFWDVRGADGNLGQDGEIWTGIDFYNIANGAYSEATGTKPTYSESAATVTLDLDSSETMTDLTYYVYYLPIEVTVGIRYFFQRPDSDEYVEDITLYVEDAKRTGSYVDEAYLTQCLKAKLEELGRTDELKDVNPGELSALKGFTRMVHQPEPVAADGSTIFECYYDREYVLLRFDQAGGYGVEPVYARYGSLLTIPDPVRPGYIFQGWTQNGNPVSLPATVPSVSQTYTASWTEKSQVQLSVVIWGQDPNDLNQYSYQQTIPVYTAPNQTVTWETLAGAINAYNCGLDYHAHSDACAKCGKTEHTHSAACCTIDPHTHGPGCYTVSGGSLSPSANNNPGYLTNVRDDIYRTRYGITRYYLKIGNSYYQITNLGNGNNAINNFKYSLNCTKSEHTHGTGCSYCKQGLSEHTHNETCCNIPVHTHSQACQVDLSNAVDSNLWKLAEDKVETVTVNINGSSVLNVYFNREEFKLSFYRSTSINDSNLVYTIQAPWGADISSHWPIPGYESGQRWKPQDAAVTYNDTLVYIAVMPPESFYLTLTTSTEAPYYMHYMLEALPGETGADIVPYTYNGETRYFRESKMIEANYNYVTKDEDFFDMEGYTQWRSNPQFGSNDRIDISGGGDVYFYYIRHRYTLAFYNPVNRIGEGRDGLDAIVAGENLGKYDYIPGPEDAPPYYEPGSVVFDGWYLSPTPDEDDKPFILANNVMPTAVKDGDTALVLYATWKEVTHQVRFFRHYEYLQEWLEATTDAERAALIEEWNSYEGYPGYLELLNAKHGIVLEPSIVEEVLGWTKYALDGVVDPEAERFGFFYMDHGVKKAYSPQDIPINDDMNIYIEWRGQSEYPYRIEYVLEEDPSVHVAAPTTGYFPRGMLHTFFAKAGSPYNQLYPAYNTGYFPVASSHSMVIQPEADPSKPAVVNVHQFRYKEVKNISYTVRYLDKATGLPLIPDLTQTTSNAVITVPYAPYEGYVPDEPYKRLVLSADESLNVVIFEYTKSVTDAPYAVHHMLEKLHNDGDPNNVASNYAIDGSGGYVEHDLPDAGIATIGNTIFGTPRTIEGFALLPDMSKLYVGTAAQDGNVAMDDDGYFTFQVSEDGSELYIFYKRLNYAYKAYYQDQSNVDVKSPDSGSAPYGSSVTITAPLYCQNYAYTLVSTQTQSITIGSNEALNRIIFRYEPLQYEVRYAPVGGGITSPSQENLASPDFQGTKAIPDANHEFAGWYLDKECTQPVFTADSPTDSKYARIEDGKFVPKLLKDSNGDPVAKYNFYAKFNLLAADFTIIRRNATPGQVFVYRITNTDGFLLDVTIHTNANRGGEVTIKNLPYGEYTVEQLNSWSWRYTADKVIRNVMHTPETPFAEYGEELGFSKWLSGIGDFIRRIFGGI